MTEGIDYSYDLERNIIGICVMESYAYDRIAGLLEPRHFRHPDHQKFFEAIKEMRAENMHIDLVTIIDRLMRLKGMPKSCISDVMRCTKEVVSSAGLEQNAYILVQMYRGRELKRLTTTPLSPDMNVNESIQHLEAQINALRQEAVISAVKMEDGLMALVKYQDVVRTREMLGITTGFKSIDDATSGFVNGGLYVVAARPSMGKSAFMGKNVLQAAVAGHKVVVIQLEMSLEQTVARIASLYTDMEYAKIITGFKYDDSIREKFYSYVNGMTKLPIMVNPMATMSIETIKGFAYAMHRKGLLDILFIDYLQLIEIKGGRSREQDVAAISRGLKLLSRDLNIPVIALSQLNRAVESRAIKKPILADLRESGAIEQDADAVYFIHRDFAMGIERDENGNSTENKAELIIAKNRNGSRMTIPLTWDGQKMKFSDETIPF
jgi:replicative DNA helicase